MSTNNIIGGAAAVGEPDNHHGHQVRLKKGPWSGAEDAILMEYVKKHGEGNWNSVQRNSGLTRCGKSCRLRWANHLRPNLKKGCFTPEEERIIIELHAKLGNKWASMASQLPGRTDNEIKNFWNTRMKRRQRAGLTLYPQEPREEAAPAFHFHKKNDHQQKRPKYSSPTSSLSSFLNSFPPKNSYMPYYPLFNSPNLSSSNPLEYPFIQSHLPSSLYSDDPTHHVGGCGLSLPLSPLNSPYSPSPSSSSTHMYNQNHGLQAITTTPEQSIVHYENADNLENNMSFTSLIMGTHVKPIGITVPGLKLELPSNQTVIPYPRSPASISTSRDTNNKGENEQAWTSEDTRNSGLLDALLMEAKTLSYGRDKPVVKDSKVGPVDKGKCVVDEPEEEDEERQVEEEKEVDKRVKLPLTNGSQESGENQRCDISSSQSSIDEAASSIDEDLLSLLSNFPSSMPLPDWYNRRTSYESNNELPYGTINDNKGINVDPNASLTRTTTTGDGTPTLEWPWDSCPWNNMSGIC